MILQILLVSLMVYIGFENLAYKIIHGVWNQTLILILVILTFLLIKTL